MEKQKDRYIRPVVTFFGNGTADVKIETLKELPWEKPPKKWWKFWRKKGS